MLSAHDGTPAQVRAASLRTTEHRPAASTQHRGVYGQFYGLGNATQACLWRAEGAELAELIDVSQYAAQYMTY